MWQSFRVIRQYRTLLLLPIISWVFCLLTSAIVLEGGALVFNISPNSFGPSESGISAEGDPGQGQDLPPQTREQRKAIEHVWLLVFFFYVANTCVVTFFNVAFAHIALDRLGGGKAILDDGLKTAWRRKYVILQWAIFAGTIGMILKTLREQSDVGKWVARLLGYLWSAAICFVMPLLALENMTPGEALFRSAKLIKQRWGEMIVAAFSFPLLFFVLAAPGVLVFFMTGFFGRLLGLATVVVGAYWLSLAVCVFSAEQVFKAALYLYAKEERVAPGFARVDLKSAWEGLPALPAGQAL